MKARRSGYVFVVVLMFVLVIIAVSFGIQAFITTFAREVGMQKTKGYYVALSGLRYAALLLGDPDTITEINNAPPPDYYVISGSELGEDFYSDVGVSLTKLKVKIRKIPLGETNAGKYEITATYTI